MIADDSPSLDFEKKVLEDPKSVFSARVITLIWTWKAYVSDNIYLLICPASLSQLHGNLTRVLDSNSQFSNNRFNHLSYSRCSVLYVLQLNHKHTLKNKYDGYDLRRQ